MAAFAAAKALALKLDCVVDVLYVEDLVRTGELLPELAPVTPDEVLERVKRAADGDLEGRWTFDVKRGQAAAILAKRASTPGASLFVMGTHARAGADRWLLGSTGEAVLRRARAPVVVVREGAELSARRLLAPTNLTLYADEAVHYALRLAQACGTALTALYVAPERTWEIDADDRLHRHLDRMLGSAAAKSIERVVRVGDGRAEIEREILTGRYGLVALSGHRRAELSDWLLGTTAERTMRVCHPPLLVVPASAAAVSREEGTS